MRRMFYSYVVNVYRIDGSEFFSKFWSHGHSRNIFAKLQRTIRWVAFSRSILYSRSLLLVIWETKRIFRGKWKIDHRSTLLLSVTDNTTNIRRKLFIISRSDLCQKCLIFYPNYYYFIRIIISLFYLRMRLNAWVRLSVSVSLNPYYSSSPYTFFHDHECTIANAQWLRLTIARTFYR